MTCENLESGCWRLGFSEPEAYFLVNVMAQLASHYREDVAQLSPPQRAYWLGRGNLPPGTMPRQSEVQSAEELLAGARLELRSERLALAEKFLREFKAAGKHDPWNIDLDSAERDEFLAMINDRRLLLALDHGIAETDMDTDPSQIENEARRAAIFEIYFLGRFIFATIGPQLYRP
ncbi:MAG TPA: hypothetical protein VL981_04865 [Candidatus Methylacidiphilales bacterium]|nr:hypothetical protein [Candidatus Methylacidiphilales bacterium]